ncbi:MAG: hypothetical protein KDI48_05490 [Xanthomonadales bacterium]|nr:hypothetical protein [Xanthomonadales bacterium]
MALNFGRWAHHAQILAGQLESGAVVEVHFQQAAALVQLDFSGSGHPRIIAQASW